MGWVGDREKAALWWMQRKATILGASAKLAYKSRVRRTSLGTFMIKVGIPMPTPSVNHGFLNLISSLSSLQVLACSFVLQPNTSYGFALQKTTYGLLAVRR
jgi:hypothetical protein